MKKLNPFKAFQSFNKKDTELYFGRDADLYNIVNELKNNSTLIIYGPLGCGKSSIVRCGFYKILVPHQTSIVILRFDREGFKVDNLLDFPAKYSKCQNIDDFCKIYYNDVSFEYCTTYFVFDQFEEVFIEDKQESACINQLINVYNWSGQKRIVFSIREEWLGHMDSLESNFPNLLGHRYRVKNASRDNVFDFLSNTLSVAGITLSGNSVDEKPIMDKLIDKLKMKNGDFLFPYIQLSLYQFWLKDKDRDERQNLLENERWIWELNEIEQDINLETAVLDYLNKSIVEISSTIELKKTPDDIWIFIQKFQKNAGLRRSEYLSNCSGFEEVLLKLRDRSIIHVKNDNLGDLEYEFTHDIMSKVVYTQENYRKKSDLINSIEARFQEYRKDKNFLLNKKRLSQMEEFGIQFDDIEINDFIKKSFAEIENKKNKEATVKKLQRVFKYAVIIGLCLIIAGLSYFLVLRNVNINLADYRKEKEKLSNIIQAHHNNELHLTNFIITSLKIIAKDPTLVQGILNRSEEEFVNLKETRHGLTAEIKTLNGKYREELGDFLFEKEDSISYVQKNSFLNRIFKEVKILNSKNIKKSPKYYGDVSIDENGDWVDIRLNDDILYFIDEDDKLFRLNSSFLDFSANVSTLDKVSLDPINKNRYGLSTKSFLRNGYYKKALTHESNTKNLVESNDVVHIRYKDSKLWFMPQFEDSLICCIDKGIMNSDTFSIRAVDTFRIDNFEPVELLDIIDSSTFILTDYLNTFKVFDRNESDSTNFQLSFQFDASEKIVFQRLVKSKNSKSRILTLGYSSGKLDIYNLEEGSLKRKYTLYSEFKKIISVVFFNDQGNIAILGVDKSKKSRIKLFKLSTYGNSNTFSKGGRVINADEGGNYIVRLLMEEYNIFTLIENKNGSSEKITKIKKGYDPTAFSIYGNTLYFKPKKYKELCSIDLTKPQKKIIYSTNSVSENYTRKKRVTAIKMVNDSIYIAGKKNGDLVKAHRMNGEISVIDSYNNSEISDIAVLDNNVIWGDAKGYVYYYNLESKNKIIGIADLKYRIDDILIFPENQNFILVSTSDGMINVIDIRDLNNTVNYIFIEDNENTFNMVYDNINKKLFTYGMNEASVYDIKIDESEVQINQNFDTEIKHNYLKTRVEKKYSDSAIEKDKE